MPSAMAVESPCFYQPPVWSSSSDHDGCVIPHTKTTNTDNISFFVLVTHRKSLLHQQMSLSGAFFFLITVEIQNVILDRLHAKS